MRNDITTIEMVIGSVITDWYIDTEKISATTEHAEGKDNNLNLISCMYTLKVQIANMKWRQCHSDLQRPFDMQIADS
jgi:hypothetical protein